MLSAEPSNLTTPQSTSVDNDDNDNTEPELKSQDYLSDSDSDNETDTNPLQCRMYENDYPEQGDLVMIKISHHFDKGAYCHLLEYNNIEGVLLNTELARKRIRKSIKSLIPAGTEHIVQVLKVDRDQHYINLSKKRVEPEDIIEFTQVWNKSKMAHSIMRQVAFNPDLKYSMKQLYKIFGWKCVAVTDSGDLYDAFKYALNNWDEFILKYPCVLEDIRPCLKKMIEKRLKAEKVTVRSEIEIECFTEEGVDAIKKALKAGLEVIEMHNQNKDEDGFGDDIDVKISLKSSPLFYVSAVTFEPDKGKELVESIVDVMNKSIGLCGGVLRVKREAHVLSMNEAK